MHWDLKPYEWLLCVWRLIWLCEEMNAVYFRYAGEC